MQQTHLACDGHTRAMQHKIAFTEHMNNHCGLICVTDTCDVCRKFCTHPTGTAIPQRSKAAGERAGQIEKAAQKGFRKNQPSEGVQSLLPELEADLCLSGETRLQRNNLLVLKLNEVDSREPHQCFKFLKFYHSSVVFWSPFCVYSFDDSNVFVASEGNTVFPIAGIKILWWSVPCSVSLLLSSFWAGVNVCTAMQSSDLCIISAFVCLFTGLI